MKGIIIGAGQGMRMGPEAEDTPKCLLDGLGGRRVLDWILDSLGSAGVDDVVFVGGCCMQKVRQAYPRLRYYRNADWSHNEGLESLMCAEAEMDTAFVASYSDIVYRHSTVQRLMASNAEVALVVDRDWRKHYAGRSHRSEAQATKVIVEDGRLVEVGKHVPIDRACGEFIGLAKFSQPAARLMRDRYRQVRNEYLARPFHRSPDIRKAYLSDMIQELTDLGVQVEPVDIWTDWAELDTPEDLEWARQQLDDHGELGLAQQVWAVRAEGYEQLEWTNRKGYLEAFVAAGDLGPHDRVLDVGTGTGRVAHAVAPLVAKVVGIDVSPQMLAYARASRVANEVFEEGDIRKLHYPDNTFNRVTARMVFHHLVEGYNEAIHECYRMLEPDGVMVLSEGVPPDPSLRDWYTGMFALKEERLTFYAEDLVALMRSGGFAVERVLTHISPQVSIGNWLRNSGLPQERQDMIMQLHLALDEPSRRHYNMTVSDNDVLCDFKFVIVVGRKCSQKCLVKRGICYGTYRSGSEPSTEVRRAG